MKRPDDKMLAKATSMFSRAAMTVDASMLQLRAGGSPLTADKRDELLERCAAGQYVELEVDMLAYEQKSGERNRNSVRFRDGALMKLGTSGKSTPFLRDHNQHDSLSKGGSIIASKTEKLDEGHYQVRQTAKLTAPWAVELALRGLLSAVSIGWRPTGPVMCSACSAPIYSKCWHWPGDRLVERENDDGSKRKVRDAAGDIVVEWIYTEAELVETSSVPIGGVPTAEAEEIRSSLAAAFPGAHGAHDPGDEDMDPKLLAMLGLAATAGASEVLHAVEKVTLERDTARKELSIADAETRRLSAIVEAHQETERKTAEDNFIRDALSSGRITKADEPAWRDLYTLSAEKAAARMNERKAGTATPVGQPRQSDAPAPAPASGSKSAVHIALAAQGVDPAKTIALAKSMGVADPEKFIADQLGLQEVA